MEREWAIEKERMTLLRSNGQNVSERHTVNEMASLKHLLPQMHNDTDSLVYFLTFERALELNDVDRSHWAKYLLPQISRGYTPIDADRRVWRLQQRETVSEGAQSSESFIVR